MSVMIVAEIGVNHNGSVQLARRLIDAAKVCGADMVKFQTFSADRLAGIKTPKVPYQMHSSDPQESHQAMLKKLELSQDAYSELKAYCDRGGIEFCSTPYSKEDAVLLYELGVKVFKVASADLVDRTLHEFLAETRRECILATGMASLDEVEETVRIYELRGNTKCITLLQCTSAYPANVADANLLAMKTLQKTFRCRVGYSDHTLGNECAMAAVVLGAELIEKHFTLNKSLPGPDHGTSCTPEELTALVRAVRLVESALGDGVKRIADSEKPMRQVSRKSVISARELHIGDVLRKEDLAFQRPGTGISPMRYPELLGRKVKRDVTAGEQLQFDDLV